MSDRLQLSDAEVVRLLESLSVPQPVRVRRSAEGGEHMVWFVNDDMVLRVPAAQGADLEPLRREQGLVDLLRAEAAMHAPELTDALPEVLQLGIAEQQDGIGGGWPFALCRKAAGVSVEEAPWAVTAATERDLAAFLALLGRDSTREAALKFGVPLVVVGEDEDEDEVLDGDLADMALKAWRRLRATNELGGDLANIDLEGYLGAATAAVYTMDEKEPVFAHADLKGEHIFVDAATGRLTGVIDWSDARAGADAGTDVGGLAISIGARAAERVVAAAAAAAGAGRSRDDAGVRRGLRAVRCEAVVRLDAVLRGADDSPEPLVRRQLARALEGLADDKDGS
ncbi:transferase [Purpureocillium lavendulum]|uniref:Transferase n=1 Tax=Purpureocillium lavendulum TaxID=1247861 RepID=A0AB34FR02_9HYPO|nr:transferase [Purpureocillium lavendulum]